MGGILTVLALMGFGVFMMIMVVAMFYGMDRINGWGNDIDQKEKS